MTAPFVTAIRINRSLIPDKNVYPYNLDCVRSLTELAFPSQVTFLVGENGSGKSTLLEALAVKLGFNAEGGSRNFRFQTRASHSALYECLEIEKGPKRLRDGYFLRAESFFNVATEIENLDAENPNNPEIPSIIDYYGGRPLHEQSHGESFLALFLNRFHGNGFYILDEPEAALSPARQLTFLVKLNALVKAGAQLIIATHSPLLTGYTPATIYELNAQGFHLTSWDQLEHVRLTRRFLMDRENTLKNLFNDSQGTLF